MEKNMTVPMQGENFILMTHLVAGQMLNAYYSAMILKKLNGEAYTPTLAGKVSGEVTDLYFSYLESVQRIFLEQSKENSGTAG